MSAVAVGKRDRRRKVKPKLSFGSTSGGPSSLPSNMEANLPELLALLTMKQKPAVPGNGTEVPASKHYLKGEILATTETPPSDNCTSQSSSHSVKPLATEQREASLSSVVQPTNFVAQADVADIVRRLRKVLQEKGPSQEDDLLETLSPWQVQLILEAYGSLIAFLDRRPGFAVVHEDLYSFVYYQEPDDEDVRDCMFLQDGATAGSACSNDSGRQHAEAGGGNPRRARVGSSSSSTSSSYESAIDEEDKEQKKRESKDGWSEVHSTPRCLSRAFHPGKDTCDAIALTQGWDPAQFSELECTLRKRDAEIAELKATLENLRESHASEVKELRAEIDKLRQAPPPRNAAKAKNRNAKKQQKQKNGAGAQVRPRPHLRQLYHPLPISRPEEKPRALPIDQKPRPIPSVEKRFRRRAKRQPVPESHEVPRTKDEAAAPRSDVESMQSSQGEPISKSKMEEQILKIVRMVKKKKPDYTDEEIRRRVDHLRRSQGGFSMMTFNAIVALLLGDLKAIPEEKREQHVKTRRLR